MHPGQGARCSAPLWKTRLQDKRVLALKMPDGGRGKRAHARVNGPARPETPTGPDRGPGPWYEAESALPVEGCPEGLSELRA